MQNLFSFSSIVFNDVLSSPTCFEKKEFNCRLSNVWVSNVLKNKAEVQAFYLTHEVSFLSVSFLCLRMEQKAHFFCFRKNISFMFLNIQKWRCLQMSMSFLLTGISGQDNEEHGDWGEYVSFASTLFMSEIKLIEQRKKIHVVQNTFFLSFNITDFQGHARKKQNYMKQKILYSQAMAKFPFPLWFTG